MPRRKATKRTRPRHDPWHGRLWAALSFGSFIVVFTSTAALSAWSVLPFAYGTAALVITLSCEYLLRGRIWLLEPEFADSFGHPTVHRRLLIFCGAFALVLETVVLTGLLVR